MRITFSLVTLFLFLLNSPGVTPRAIMQARDDGINELSDLDKLISGPIWPLPD
ncbi:hypothetical protein PILCRDRAFT_817091 [Piloderma croceum F 1598]|uniref:Uncharacterized protein n=1 Tax=Piloderma croceum (strain F 1598) TaxID=765440 RepID=A0A0C3G1V9_PILCF|nr:hypothetical protein PILCRDRAFT_817091 [Piloderma croceum F 1598]